jgi:hypothetical protein
VICLLLRGRLLGVSVDGEQRCLILQMCPAGSLFDVLQNGRKQLKANTKPTFGWRQRVEVAVAIARALVHMVSLC